MNLFSAITSWIGAYNALSWTKTWQNLIGQAKQAIAPITQPIQQAFTPAIKTAKSAVSPITSAVSTVAQPVIQNAVHEDKVAKVKKPYQEQLTKLGITAQHLDEMGLSDEEKQAVKDLYSQVWVEIPWFAQQEQAKIQSDKIKSEDWLSQKSYFWDQRPNEWIIEQAGKWIIRTPLTYAQNLIAWPENIEQWALNFLDKTLWEWVLNPALNAIWGAIKWDKYKDLPTWYNDVPSTNQYTENVVSNMVGAGKEALTTNKSYSQANEELKQQQYKAGKDQWIGGSLANIGGGAVSSAFNIMAPWASALFAWASEMPWTQYVTQWLGALTQAPIDYAVSKSGGTEETANQIGTMANLALPLARNKVAWMKPTSAPGKLLQKTVVTTADAIINPLWAIKDAWTAVFSKNPRSVEDIAGNILQPYKWMTENLEDATAWVRRVVEETGTKTSTYDGLLTAIKNTQNKYGKMLSDSLGQITTSTRSQLFDTALTQLAKIYEWVSSSDMKATLTRINELGKKNVTTGLTPAEKNEVKILHTKANNLFNEKGKETGWFSSDDLRGMRRDMVSEINKEASDAGITNVADINKAYWELSDARTLAENQVANLKAYKWRTPPPTTMAKITNMIVDFPIIKQVFSDPTRAVASALFKNLRWDKINPIEVQWRLSGFLKELKKAGAKAEEIKKIEQIMLSMKLLPERSSAKIPLTQTEQDKAIIKQSKPSNITKNGNLDNSIPSSNNNRTKSIKKPASKPIVKPNTIKNESKVSNTQSSDTIPEGTPKVIWLTENGWVKNVEPWKQVKYNQWDSYEPVRMALTQKDADISRFWALSKKQMKTSVSENEKLEMAGIKGRLKMSNAELETRAQEIRDIAKLARSNKESVLVDLRNWELPEGYFKNAFWEIQKNSSNKKGGFIKIPEIGKKVEPNPIVNKQTWETLSQAIDKLRWYGWEESKIQKFKNTVLWKWPKKIIYPEWTITSVNPTGSIMVEYNPQSRMTAPLAKNIVTLDKTSWKSPDTIVTIYRWAPKIQKEINPWDFITTNYDNAKSYTNDKWVVLSKKVKMSDILDDMEDPSWNWWEEYLYRPTKKVVSRDSRQPTVKNPLVEEARKK